MTTVQHPLLRGLTALSLMMPFASMANSAVFENGFFIGGKIGGQEAMASWEQTANLTMEDSLTGDELDASLGDYEGQAFHANLMGNISAGYQHIVEKYFLAAEVSVNVATEQELGWEQNQTVGFDGFLDSASLNVDTDVELENPDVILDLRPGILLAKNFLLYGRIGVAFNKLSIEQEIVSTFTDGYGAFEQLNLSSSEDENVAGLRVGLGMEYKITPNLGLNMDYVFTDYDDIDTALLETVSHSEKKTFDPFDSTTYVSSEASITKSTATVGLNWYFGKKKQKQKQKQFYYEMPDK